MRRTQGRLQRKGITSLSIITTPVVILVMSLCILVVQQNIQQVFGYVVSGSSFFFPFIPVINLLAFLPQSVSVHPFTTGNLLDIIVNIYIILTIGIIPYKWHKSAREPGIAFEDITCSSLINPSRPRMNKGTRDDFPRGVELSSGPRPESERWSSVNRATSCRVFGNNMALITRLNAKNARRSLPRAIFKFPAISPRSIVQLRVVHDIIRSFSTNSRVIPTEIFTTINNWMEM